MRQKPPGTGKKKIGMMITGTFDVCENSLSFFLLWTLLFLLFFFPHACVRLLVHVSFQEKCNFWVLFVFLFFFLGKKYLSYINTKTKYTKAKYNKIKQNKNKESRLSTDVGSSIPLMKVGGWIDDSPPDLAPAARSQADLPWAVWIIFVGPKWVTQQID